jgi:hypothetical protein
MQFLIEIIETRTSFDNTKLITYKDLKTGLVNTMPYKYFIKKFKK